MEAMANLFVYLYAAASSTLIIVGITLSILTRGHK